MALINPEDSIKVDIPHEPGEWVRYRVVTAADLEVMGDDISTLAIVAAALREWSYEAPPSLDTVRQLDFRTATWLTQLVTEASQIRSEPEKRDLDSPSSRTLARVEGGSRKRSAI